MLPCARPFASINTVRPCLVRRLACEEKPPVLKFRHFGGTPSICKKLRLLSGPILKTDAKPGRSEKTNKKKEPAKTQCFCGFSVARLKGLEPLTYWFVASHSIQLSYKRNFSVPI